jgi:fructuronate reductase
VKRLAATSLDVLPDAVVRPAFVPARLKCGIVHLGLGAFHRGHQAVFTDDAIGAEGGDWGIVGASLRRPDDPDGLVAQDCLYTVEMLGDTTSYRVIGAERAALFAPRDRAALLAALAAPATHVVTLTVSEKGYCLTPDGMLDTTHPDIAADLANPRMPVSAIGWLALGLETRRRTRSGPLTILSCDNLQSNGARLAAAVTLFAERAWPTLAARVDDGAGFPLTLVDSIVPASTAEHRARVAAALGVEDAASVQRETFAQWVIQDRFQGPIPAWGAAGAEIVPNIDGYQRLKLHVLNTAHSALAYLGLPRGHVHVRQAMADRHLRNFLDAMMAEEITPALSPLDVGGYWKKIKVRLENPSINHRLAQIAEDGSLKLSQRLYPILVENARASRPIARIAAIVRAWLDLMATEPVSDPARPLFAEWTRAGTDRARAQALEQAALFPEAFRENARLRAAILEDD